MPPGRPPPSDHPNAAVAKAACAALRSADRKAIAVVFVDDAELVVPGRNPTAGVYTGWDEIAGYAMLRQELCGATFRSPAHDILAKEGHTVIIERWMAKRGERCLDMRVVTLMHIFDGYSEGGIILVSDPYKVDDFWN